MKLDDIRRDFARDGLRRSQLASSPFEQFAQWMQQAIDFDLRDPTAMTLATVDETGAPSQRIVLLKEFGLGGFVFFTNYDSNKAQDLAVNARASLHFPWHDLDRQVHVLGRAEKILAQDSKAYFDSRPRGSKIGALASRQSEPIESREALELEVEKLNDKYAGADVPYPDNWGGFRVVPSKFEFWQGRHNRLHDRFVYDQCDSDWAIYRLSP